MKELITYPLNDVDYSAEDAGLFHCTRKSGVWYQDSFPIEVSGADNTIFIGKGLAWFSNTEFWGKVAAQKTKVSLDLEYADTVYDRIDVIALQFDANKNATNLIVKKGEAKTNPTIPSISRTEAVYELYLYAITRPAASLTVTSENVRDLRLDDAYCGLMADSVTSLDFPIVPVEKGGTGKNFLTPNSVLVGNGSENVKNIPSKTGALYVDGNQTEPKFDILPVNAGGTGSDHHTINSVLVGDAGKPVKHVSTSNGALYATGANSAPKFGTLPIAQGGTGAKSIADARANLGLGSVATESVLPISKGGTGATTASGARNALGLGNTTGALPVANGGTGATTTSAARANLGLGSVATESVLPISKGGTGATTAGDVLKKLGLSFYEVDVNVVPVIRDTDGTRYGTPEIYSNKSICKVNSYSPNETLLNCRVKLDASELKILANKYYEVATCQAKPPMATALTCVSTNENASRRYIAYIDQNGVIWVNPSADMNKGTYIGLAISGAWVNV